MQTVNKRKAQYLTKTAILANERLLVDLEQMYILQIKIHVLDPIFNATELLKVI